MWTRTVAVMLCMLTVITTAPFSFAELGSTPLGTITTQESVKVGSTTAPTGTTIFTGDRVTSDLPSLIDLGNGSRIELTKAEAAFVKEGKTLVINADQGLLRFNFAKGNDVRIETEKYQFTTEGSTENLGEIGLNRNGQVIVEMAQGAFHMMNKNTGVMSLVTPGQPMLLLAQIGKGQISKNGSSLTDTSKIFQPNELKGMCVVSGSEAYPVIGNTTSIISIRGSWSLDSGYHSYEVVECEPKVLTSAGVSSGVAAEAVKSAAASGTSAAFPTSAAILAGAGAGAGIGLGAYYAAKDEKSPSDR